MPIGPEEDSHEIGCALGSCVGAATATGFGGLGLGHRAFGDPSWRLVLATRVDIVHLGQCGVRRAFDKAPHVPLAGNPAVSMFNGKLLADVLFLAKRIALRAMRVFYQVPPFDTRSSEEPSRCSGHLLLFADRGFRPPADHPDRWTRRVGE